MKNILLIISLLTLNGCVLVDSLMSNDFSHWDKSCPEPEKSSNGMLALENGKTLKCQVRQATSNMGCNDDFTNEAGDDGLACTNSSGGAIFFFDEKGVLKSYDFLNK